MQNRHQQHIRLNDIVLIHDESLPRLTWRKGIVVELLKGPDGKMRGTEVRTLNGSILKRPITKLFPIKYFEWQLNEGVGENVDENVCDNVVQTKRNAELLKKYVDDLLTINSWVF